MKKVETKKIIWMIKKDLLVLWRHKPRLFSIFLFPILMIALFGYGMGGSIENVPIVVVKQTDGQMTDTTINAIKNSSLYDVKDIIGDPQRGREMVESGQVKAAIILPSDYEDLNDSNSKSVVVYVDSSDQMATSVLVPATQALFSQMSAEIGMQKLEALQTQSAALQVQSQGVQASSGLSGINFQNIMNSINFQINKIYGDIKYIDFLVPAILAMTVMMGAMMSMGESLAGERERGELARLFMTPTSVSTVVGGKIISRLIIQTATAMVLLAAAIILFNITIAGSILLTILLLILTALCFVGFGIMVSARVSTQEDYVQMVMPFSMPMMFISGVFYPLETMPWIFQKIAYIAPLTYANNALRAVMLQGAGIGDIWVELVVLLGFTLLFFAMGVTRFNRDI
ncbi:ABC transporter permease [Methanobacterium petrolearium]|uniref:ABC transporter permease n=1 Tax=Methanobacterium petrolearium TaxID=710190 RepID=UPI001AE966D3|nr:ABC transporter permease [Methanobacterium petrolearium]MBP1944882.1 ABC-2 type transport system permease protein [Methanobacterium petrolearium]